MEYFWLLVWWINIFLDFYLVRVIINVFGWIIFLLLVSILVFFLVVLLVLLFKFLNWLKKLLFKIEIIQKFCQYFRQYNIWFLVVASVIFFILLASSLNILVVLTGKNTVYFLNKSITISDTYREQEIKEKYSSFSWTEIQFKDKLDLINDYNSERINGIQTTLDIVTIFLTLLVLILWVVWFAQYKDIKDRIVDWITKKVLEENSGKIERVKQELLKKIDEIKTDWSIKEIEDKANDYYNKLRNLRDFVENDSYKEEIDLLINNAETILKEIEEIEQKISDKNILTKIMGTLSPYIDKIKKIFNKIKTKNDTDKD